MMNMNMNMNIDIQEGVELLRYFKFSPIQENFKVGFNLKKRNFTNMNDMTTSNLLTNLKKRKIASFQINNKSDLLNDENKSSNDISFKHIGFQSPTQSNFYDNNKKNIDKLVPLSSTKKTKNKTKNKIKKPKIPKKKMKKKDTKTDIDGNKKEKSKNRRGPKGASTYRGVCITKAGKWRSVIYRARRQIYLGVFDNEIEAARAFDRAAVFFFAKDDPTIYEKLNFPDSPPDPNMTDFEEHVVLGRVSPRPRNKSIVEIDPSQDIKDKEIKKEINKDIIINMTPTDQKITTPKM